MQQSDFSSLYQSSYAYLYRLVASIEGSMLSAEDTVQDIFLAAWICFRGKEHPNPFGWLVLTARHKACDSLRRKIRETNHFVSLDAPDCPEMADPNDFFHSEAETDYGQVRTLLRREEFDLVIARYELGFSVNELAEKLQISSAACRMRLSRACRKLKILVP